MKWDVRYSESAGKQLRKLDAVQRAIVLSWVDKHLDQCDNPRIYGKPLIGNKKGYWRYRVGVYRLIADIQDEVIAIEIIHIAHRRDVYR